jgi:hypothetical protein
MNNIRKAAFYSSIAVMTIVMITSNQLPIYASPTTEDDGWTEGDYEGSPEEQEEQAQEDWEDAGRPGDDDESGNGNGNDDNGPNPYCDQVPNNYQGACHDRLDYHQGGPNDGLYPCNDGTNMYDWRDCKDASKKDTSSSSDSDNDIPECVNGVTQECLISAIGLICSPGYDLSNPSIVGGGHACQDIYAGTYKPQPEPEPESKLKNCGDGVVAVSCGVGRYWCSGGSSSDSFHTNDYRDCEEQ